MTRQPRFTGALLATLALAGAGVASGQRTLFVAAAIPLAFVLFGALSTPASPDTLDVERAFSNPSPLPGDRVVVTLTVENTDEQVLPDVRLADGVPADIQVVGGRTESAVALPAGESTTIEYTVVADRGQFAFEAPIVRVRGASAAAFRTAQPPTAGDEVLDCRVTVADLPLRHQTTAYAGDLPTDTGGPGIEFHSTRDYQRGDPVSRINWRRYAKTGDLSTVNYRERRSAAVVLAVDAREVNDVSARTGTPSGASLSAYAAAQTVEPLEQSGHQVGLAVFGISDPASGVEAPAWVPPGSGDAHHARVASVLETALTEDDGTSSVDANDVDADEAAGEESTGEPSAATATDGAGVADGESARAGNATSQDSRIGRFAERVPPGTQVVVCSPALDEFPATLARRLATAGHSVTAVCPDVTATDTPGRTLVAAERALTIDDLRATETQVVDWAPDEPLAGAVTRATTAVREGDR